MDASITLRSPAPPTVVDCPWCASPAPLDPGIADFVCPTCGVTAELAPPAPRRVARVLEPAA